MRVALLLRWYRKYKRDLPWRKDQDPYRVMVSEFMLVQTTVATVVKRYEEFLRGFPSVEALAAAPLWKVKNAWTGLGYNSRAENLWKAANQIVSRGGFPRTPGEFKGLAGFGPYLSAAVASIAFEVKAPVYDVNVARVLLRLFGSSEMGILEQIFAENRFKPSELNQALMELGALACKAREPACEACPVRGTCLTRGVHPSERKPVKSRALELVIHLRRDSMGRVLLVRRGADEVFLKDCWGLPMEIVKTCPGRRVPQAFRHAITKWRIHAHVRSERPGIPAPIGAREARWFKADKLKRHLFSSLWWKALETKS
ncbi:MAG: A/G-specific adenine glycosylase [Elusimicrobiota bacterium]